METGRGALGAGAGCAPPPPLPPAQERVPRPPSEEVWGHRPLGLGASCCSSRFRGWASRRVHEHLSRGAAGPAAGAPRGRPRLGFSLSHPPPESDRAAGKHPAGGWRDAGRDRSRSPFRGREDARTVLSPALSHRVQQTQPQAAPQTLLHSTPNLSGHLRRK